jgi:DNA-binding MarR family transcriptional regulator
MPSQKLETAVLDFAQAVGLFVRRIRAAATSQELSMTESLVMSSLDKNGPATIADLARSEGMKPQSMGATVSSLESMGMIERRPHPTDGRQMHIALTAKGSALRKTTYDAKKTWLTLAVAELDEADQETLFKAGEIIRRLAIK